MEKTASLFAATGAFRGRALLIERLAFRAVNEAFENDGTILNPNEGSRRDR